MEHGAWSMEHGAWIEDQGSSKREGILCDDNSPLSRLKETFGLDWPEDDSSPKNVYEKLIHPLHAKWSQRLNKTHIYGGEGNTALSQHKTERYIEIIQEMVAYKMNQGSNENVLVCETGYNMGHSALTYLFGAEGMSDQIDVMYMGFSFPQNNHQMIAMEMKDAFGLADRFSIFWGDSTKTLPYFIEVEEKNQALHQCDIVIVDGGHSVDVATKDIAKMASLANKDHHVLIVDDLACDAGYCRGPVQAWNQAKSNGAIKEDGCWGDGGVDAGAMTAQRNGKRGFCWGKYNFSE